MAYRSTSPRVIRENITGTKVKPLRLAATPQSATSSYISSMDKRKRETEWEVICIRATPAALVGTVEALDPATALKTAIKQFNIRPKDPDRLVTRPT
jgi:hypothetical protein